jgi:putative PIN family toxin of toxin-antitoxin system
MRSLKRIVVDTNVMVSRPLAGDSVPGRAAEKAIHHATLLVSQATMSELADILAQAKFDRYVTIEQRLQFIRLIAHTARFVPIVHAVRECRDPKDDKFLELALDGRADLIITGDAGLLGMHPWREIAILSSSDYLSEHR